MSEPQRLSEGGSKLAGRLLVETREELAKADSKARSSWPPQG
jgi:hypothetical protein